MLRLRQTRRVPPRNLDRLTRIYGPTTWDVYDELDVSLDPRGPDSLHELAAELLRPGDVVLDAGCRDGEHLIRLVQANDVTGVGVEPVPIHVERARAAVEAAGLAERITLHEGVMHDVPSDDSSFDFVWCRDTIVQVDDVDGALRELARVLRPGGRVLVATTFSSPRYGPGDDALLRQHLGYLEGALDDHRMEAAFERAGFMVERKDVVGTEWREFAEERTKPVSRALLRLARLRRRRDELVAAHGEDVIDHVEANLHWEVFQFLGKLVPVVYVLRQR